MTYEIMGTRPLRELRPEVVGDRSRFDLMWFDGSLGIRGPAKEDFSFDFLKVERPDTPTPGILEMLEDFPELSFPIAMAQLRFREGVHGERGLWIDASNLAIHDLLKVNTTFLDKVTEKGWIVEVGQKAKEVSRDANGDWRLVPSQPRAWLPTYTVNNEEVYPLSFVSLFSQPGKEVNRALLAACYDLLDEIGVPSRSSWCEWGAGYGNLSLGLVSRLGSESAWVSEYDPIAGGLLKENLANLAPGVEALCQPAENKSFPVADFWLMDPPRSGFSSLLQGIHSDYPGPQWVLAFHCHKKGLLSDVLVLKEKGYRLMGYSTVDAFPGTPHHEVISLWQK